MLETREFAKKNSSNNNDLLEVEKLLAEIYETSGKHEEALIHKNNYIELKDSIQKSSLTNAIAFHQTRFKTSQKEKEILKQEIEIQELELEKQIAKSKRNKLIAILFLFSTYCILDLVERNAKKKTVTRKNNKE